MNYESVIGLEVHIHLLTLSKIFCSCATSFGAAQNSQVCPVCLGMPGVLPVLNRRAVEFAIRLAIATHSKINSRSVFARKNYFYPDLPKGYQISQFEEPFCERGYVSIVLEDGHEKQIGLTRIHLEEDAGKSVHAEDYVGHDETLVDINRCGVPLLEIVSEPDLRSAQEAFHYLVTLRQLVRYLEICDGNMEEGSLRCDANVSIRPKGSGHLGVKTELKNMNSFRSVERAIEFEIQRQIKIVEQGGTIQQESLLWDADRNCVSPMRSKEFSHDYRYFPEPDLVPLHISPEQIQQVVQSLPELPEARKKRFADDYHLPDYDIEVLTEDRHLADYYEAAAAAVGDKKVVSNWVMGEVLRILKEQKIKIDELKVTPDYLAQIIQMIESGVISGKIAKQVFDECAGSGEVPERIVKERGLQQIADQSELEGIVERILTENPDKVAAFLAGKEKMIGFFVGQAMRATDGKANPQALNEMIMKKIKK